MCLYPWFTDLIKFTVPFYSDLFSHINRDVENDETMFYLILPADYKSKDSEAEVFALTRVGRRVSYRSLRDVTGGRMDSIDENDEVDAGTMGLGSPSKDGGIKRSDTDEDSSITSSGSKKTGLFKRNKSTTEHEVVYMYRVLLDGNEKFIWLQAAAEMGRLCSESSTNLASCAVDVTK